MNFGQALEALKIGSHVQRVGWNGKGMHIYLEDGSAEKIGDGVFNGEVRRVEPYICMWTAGKTHQPGWNASQADMLADDW
jgi:hypothetical protein